MRLASSLDAVTNSNGEITNLATEITKSENEECIITLYKRILTVINTKDYPKEITQIASSLREAFITYLGFCRLKQICTNEKQHLDEGNEKSLSELLCELDSLIGLQKVKAEVMDIISYQKIQKLRRENNLFSVKSTMHMAFTGNPGTGKTTVARIVGHIFKQLGILSKGHFLEVSRTDLITGYQGQTALKVKNVIESIKGGVLFIDEAYSITENDHSDSYGRECLTELTKALEDYRDDLVVIVAGYTEPMKLFFASNPGLKSRFNIFINFDDYEAPELLDIFNLICKNNDYAVSSQATQKVSELLQNSVANKNENFANGRFVRNLYDTAVMNHARRVSMIEAPSRNDLMIIDEVDITLYN